MEVTFILNDRVFPSNELFTAALLHTARHCPDMQLRIAKTRSVKHSGIFLPLIDFAGANVTAEHFFDLMGGLLFGGLAPEGVLSCGELGVAAPGRAADDWVLLLNYLNKTLVKELLVFETLERDRGLADCPFFLAPMRRYYQQHVKGNVRKHYLRYLDGLFGPDAVKPLQTHRQRLAFLRVQNAEMRAHLGAARPAGGGSPAGELCLLALDWFDAYISGLPAA